MIVMSSLSARTKVLYKIYVIGILVLVRTVLF